MWQKRKKKKPNNKKDECPTVYNHESSDPEHHPQLARSSPRKNRKDGHFFVCPNIIALSKPLRMEYDDPQPIEMLRCDRRNEVRRMGILVSTIYGIRAAGLFISRRDSCPLPDVHD